MFSHFGVTSLTSFPYGLRKEEGALKILWEERMGPTRDLADCASYTLVDFEEITETALVWVSAHALSRLWSGLLLTRNPRQAEKEHEKVTGTSHTPRQEHHVTLGPLPRVRRQHPHTRTRALTHWNHFDLNSTFTRTQGPCQINVAWVLGKRTHQTQTRETRNPRDSWGSCQNHRHPSSSFIESTVLPFAFFFFSSTSSSNIPDGRAIPNKVHI